LNTLLEYDFTSDSWTQKTNCPISCADHTALIHNNKMYVFGGGISDGASHIYLSNRIVEYDFQKDTWKGQAIGNISCRYAHTSNLFNKRLYVFGGKSENFITGDNQIFYNDMWEYTLDDGPFDVNEDGKTGLEESIHILRIISGYSNEAIQKEL